MQTTLTNPITSSTMANCRFRNVALSNVRFGGTSLPPIVFLHGT